RGSITRTVVVLALFSSRGADAQVVAPSPSWAYGKGFLYYPHVETLYERKDLPHAERALWLLEAKLRHAAERGDSAGVGRNIYRINEVKYRMAVDGWLIRMRSLHDPGYYPLRTDAVSAAYIAEAARPSEVTAFPQPIPGPTGAAPTASITIVNAGPVGVAFAINGVAHLVASGSRQKIILAPASTITYDGGGSIGQRRYSISQGLYEFRSTNEGWALYKLRDTP